MHKKDFGRGLYHCVLARVGRHHYGGHHNDTEGGVYVKGLNTHSRVSELLNLIVVEVDRGLGVDDGGSVTDLVDAGGDDDLARAICRIGHGHRVDGGKGWTMEDLANHWA